MKKNHLLTNTENYLGSYVEGQSYKKFDIVFHESSHKFYYAKEDIAYVEDFTLTGDKRFYLDPNGPIWGGFKTFYIYDYDDDLGFIRAGQKIVISNSENNSGSFLIIKKDEGYSDKDIVAGDFILSEVLDASEGSLNNFTSEWFLAGVNNFTWNGRDWTNYVKRDSGLTQDYQIAVDNGYSLGIEAWGKEHYIEFGEAENRSVPTNVGGEDIWVDWLKNHIKTNIVGFNKTYSKESLDPDEKSLYFQFHGLTDELTFFTRKKFKIENQDKAYVYIDDTSPIKREHVFDLHDLNVDFRWSGTSLKESIDKIKFSDDGLRCVVKKGTVIELYYRNGGESTFWILGDSINVGSNFLLSAISDDCSHIAYCSWPGIVQDLELINGGSGWLNGYSTGIIELSKPVPGYGNLFTILLALDLKVKLVGTVSQAGVSGSEGEFDATVKNGVITSIAWITEPSFLSNDQGLEFSFKTYAKYVDRNGKGMSSFNVPSEVWYELDKIHNYSEKVKPYINTQNSIGSGFEATTNNPVYFSDQDLAAGWMSDIHYSVEGFLSIIEYSNGQFNNKFHEQGFFYSVGNFTSDNQTLILGSHNWSSDPSDRKSAKGRVQILNLSNNLNKDVDIKGVTGGNRQYQLSDGGEGQIYKAASGFIEIGDGIKNPVVISRDGNWFAMIASSGGWSSKSVYLYKKVNNKWLFVDSSSVSIRSAGNAELLISGDNSVIMLADGKLKSWVIEDSSDPSFIKIVKNDDRETVDVDEFISTEGDINWGEQTYQVSSQTKNGGPNGIRSIIPSRSSSGRVRALAMNIHSSDIESPLYFFDSLSSCELLEFSVTKKKWETINKVTLPNFYFLTHGGANYDLSQIMILNVRPSGDQLYPTGRYSGFSQPSEASDIDHRGLFVGSMADVENYVFEVSEGWGLIEKVNADKYNQGFAFDIYIESTNKWWSVKQGIASRDSIIESDRTDTPVINIDQSSEQKDPLLSQGKQTRLWVRGFTESDTISSPEISSSQTIIQTENRPPGDGDFSDWSSDSFFFDADYGSSVRYIANNYAQQYGNGYYRLQPKSINSLNFTANLKFKNRESREANAIIHFVENKFGQHEREAPSNNLKFKNDIKGFLWDGMSTFFPYDSTKTQSLDFYCSEANHSLNFENSNDINISITNYNYSTIRTQDGGFVRRAKDYNLSDFYQKNDVVYAESVDRYYYYINDKSSSFVRPFNISFDGTGQEIVEDANQEYWTRSFQWRPSANLNVNQKFRVQKSSMGNASSQVYYDGINESLLKLDLSFKNRDDSEAYAILHFLEHCKGYLPFEFVPPAPYDRMRNFVCQEWTHVYEYKNNHSISVKFVEYPLNFTASERDNKITSNKLAVSSKPKLVTENPLMIRRSDDAGTFDLSRKYRYRGVLKNVGGEDLEVVSVRCLSDKMDGSFKVVGSKDFDYSTYVNIYPDLENYWKTNIDGQGVVGSQLSKYEWGKVHWEQWGGNTEFRIMPAIQFRFSNEFLYSEKNSNDIIKMYQVMLSRTPSSDEYYYWINDVINYKNNKDVMFGIMDSDEYKWKYILYDNPSFNDSVWLESTPDESSINFVYQHLLGRNADASGLDYYSTHSDIFNTNYSIWVTLRMSPEFFARINLELVIGTLAFKDTLATIPVWSESNISDQSEYIIQLPAYDEGNWVNLSSANLNLYGKKIKIDKKAFTPGQEGGLTFHLLDDDLLSLGKYIQKNDGEIYYTKDRNISLLTDYYINQEFIKMHSDTKIKPGQTRYFEVSFDLVDGELPENKLVSIGDTEIQYEDSQGNRGNIVVSSKEDKYSGKFVVRGLDMEQLESNIILRT